MSDEAIEALKGICTKWLTVTMLNGVEVETELKPTGEKCADCDRPALRAEFQNYPDMEEFVIDEFCEICLVNMYDEWERRNR